MLSHPSGISRLLCPSQLPHTPPQELLPREVIAAGPPAAPAQLPPPAGSQGSDQQPGFNPLNTSHIDPGSCSAPPHLASPPPTLSRLICTTLISHTANFSIWLLCTQGAQARLVPVHPPSFPRCSCMPWEVNRCLAILGFLHLSRTSLAPLNSFPRETLQGQVPGHHLPLPQCPDGMAGWESRWCLSLPCRLAATGNGYSRSMHSTMHPWVQGPQKWPWPEPPSASPATGHNVKELRAHGSPPRPPYWRLGSSHSPLGTNHPLTL